MRKLIFTCIVLLAFANLQAQEEVIIDGINNRITTPMDSIVNQQTVTEICGISFGTSYEDTRKLLENKYGRPDYYPDRTIITYKNKIYADITFDAIHFLFQSDGVNSYLNGSVFVLKAKTAKDARQKRDFLRDRLGRKYKLMSDEDENGFKFYYGGKAPTQDGTFAFHIDVIKYEEGIYQLIPAYAARIAYGRYNYVKEEF